MTFGLIMWTTGTGKESCSGEHCFWGRWSECRGWRINTCAVHYLLCVILLCYIWCVMFTVVNWCVIIYCVTFAVIFLVLCLACDTVLYFNTLCLLCCVWCYILVCYVWCYVWVCIFIMLCLACYIYCLHILATFQSLDQFLFCSVPRDVHQTN